VCGQIDRGRFSRFSRVVLYFQSLLVSIRLGVVAFQVGSVVYSPPTCSGLFVGVMGSHTNASDAADMGFPGAVVIWTGVACDRSITLSTGRGTILLLWYLVLLFGLELRVCNVEIRYLKLSNICLW
jgi:hypothetical protein